MSKKKLIIASIITLCLVFTIALFLFFHIQHKKSYERAVKLVKENQLEEAYQLFSGLKNYRDSKNQLAELRKKDFMLPFKLSEKGSILSFGKYQQDGNLENGMEDINWIILDRIENEVLLLSEDIIEVSSYNPKPFVEVTWSDCQIRKFLNGEFFQKAFSDQEKEAIILTENTNPDHACTETEGGPDTFDKVFLLSETESKIYFNDTFSREYLAKAFASQYIQSKGIMSDENGFSPWWLRSPGVYGYSAQFVNEEGQAYASGAYVDLESTYGIRPAVWINTDMGRQK